MKITLRKAAQVQSEIVKKIADLAHQRSRELTAVEGIDIVAKRRLLIQEFEAAQKNTERLTHVQYTIRERVTQANGQCGISETLTQMTFAQTEARRIAALLKGAAAAVGDDELTAAYQQRLAQILNNTAGISRFGAPDTITVDLITPEFRAELEARLLQHRRTADSLSDRILSLNTTTFVEVDDADWTFLAQLGVV